MKLIPTILSVLTILSNSLFAQTEFIIRGTVKDHFGIPIPNSIIILENNTDSSVIKSVVADNSGIYSISNLSITNTSIKSSALGFKTKSHVFAESANTEIRLDFVLEKKKTNWGKLLFPPQSPYLNKK